MTRSASRPAVPRRPATVSSWRRNQFVVVIVTFVGFTGSTLVTPFLAFGQALPPGGAIYYRGDELPAFTNSVLVASLGGEHLHHIRFDGRHEVYLGEGSGFGRLRDIVSAPDGSVYVTTSNCDGRGSCGAEKDAVLRITQN